MNVWYAWMMIFFLLVIGFAFCLKTSKNRKAYWLYMISGSAIGFVFDLISFSNGYYYYPTIFPVTVLGLPLSMTIAEGMSVAITIRIFESVMDRFFRK